MKIQVFDFHNFLVVLFYKCLVHLNRLNKIDCSGGCWVNAIVWFSEPWGGSWQVEPKTAVFFKSRVLVALLLTRLYLII